MTDFVEDFCVRRAGAKADVKRTLWGYLIEGEAPQVRSWPILRRAATLAGSAFIFGFVGLWALPGSSYAPELIPFKLGLSALFVLLGVVLIQLGQEKGQMEIEVDNVHKEIRTMERGSDGKTKLLEVVPFAMIGEVVPERGGLAVYSLKGDLISRFRMKNGTDGRAA